MIGIDIMDDLDDLGQTQESQQVGYKRVPFPCCKTKCLYMGPWVCRENNQKWDPITLYVLKAWLRVVQCVCVVCVCARARVCAHVRMHVCRCVHVCDP